MDKKIIYSTLQSYEQQLMTETPVAAAVLILFLYDDNDFYIIVTKRSDFVATYAGDYCFPGGIKEMFDNDLKQTAMRETEEELGISHHTYELIGQLDDFIDRFGKLVRPYVAMMPKTNFDKIYKHSEEEVAEVFYFPVRDLMKFEIDSSLEKIAGRHPTYSYRNGPVLIWGLTASIMVHLGNIIFQMNKPVGKK